MLHTCQTCGEAWADYFIASLPSGFEVNAESKEVEHCPNCRIVDKDEPFYTKKGETSA